MAAYHTYIKLAIERGYWFDFDTQEIVSPFGTRTTPKLFGTQRYPSYTISLRTGDKSAGSFPVHKFVGYILFGESSFEEGVNVRHLDDNPLNLSRDNIALGSRRDNEMDKDPLVRSNSAKRGRQSQGLRPLNRMISDDVALQILREYLEIKGDLRRAPRGTVKALADKYGFKRVTVQSICSGTNFKDIYNKVMEGCDV
ncbi:MAG: helix-turn-helix domain-containing protein [Myoviridae sp. ctThM1]|nr:MAG: helix-turn-helix domain-containing protein [Myoviridae sp. ctThM1]